MNIKQLLLFCLFLVKLNFCYANKNSIFISTVDSLLPRSHAQEWLDIATGTTFGTFKKKNNWGIEPSTRILSNSTHASYNLVLNKVHFGIRTRVLFGLEKPDIHSNESLREQYYNALGLSMYVGGKYLGFSYGIQQLNDRSLASEKRSESTKPGIMSFRVGRLDKLFLRAATYG